MKSPICEMLGAEFPLVAFSHCKDVVVAVSKAGGVGVLGAVGMSPETLEQELNWIDERIDQKESCSDFEDEQCEIRAGIRRFEGGEADGVVSQPPRALFS